jgi:hypothetical protein
VDQLDPLHPEPRGADLHHERSFQYGADEERLKGELQQLLGHSWESATKVITDLEDAARL